MAFLYDYMTESELELAKEEKEFEMESTRLVNAMTNAVMKHELNVKQIDSQCMFENLTDEQLTEAYENEYLLYMEETQSIWQKIKEFFAKIFGKLGGKSAQVPSDVANDNVKLPGNPGAIRSMLDSATSLLKNSQGNISVAKVATGFFAGLGIYEAFNKLKEYKNEETVVKAKDLPKMADDLTKSANELNKAIPSGENPGGDNKVLSTISNIVMGVLGKARELISFIKRKIDEFRGKTPTTDGDSQQSDNNAENAEPNNSNQENNDESGTSNGSNNSSGRSNKKANPNSKNSQKKKTFTDDEDFGVSVRVDDYDNASQCSASLKELIQYAADANRIKRIKKDLPDFDGSKNPAEIGYKGLYRLTQYAESHGVDKDIIKMWRKCIESQYGGKKDQGIKVTTNANKKDDGDGVINIASFVKRAQSWKLRKKVHSDYLKTYLADTGSHNKTLDESQITADDLKVIRDAWKYKDPDSYSQNKAKIDEIINKHMGVDYDKNHDSGTEDEIIDALSNQYHWNGLGIPRKKDGKQYVQTNNKNETIYNPNLVNANRMTKDELGRGFRHLRDLLLNKKDNVPAELINDKGTVDKWCKYILSVYGEATDDELSGETIYESMGFDEFEDLLIAESELDLMFESSTISETISEINDIFESVFNNIKGGE